MISVSQAIEAAKDRYADHWTSLSPSHQTEAIYEEMRRLDAEAFRANSAPVRSKSEAANRKDNE